MDRENIHKMPCVTYRYVQSALRSRMILISTSNSSIYCAQFIFIMCILSCFGAVPAVSFLDQMVIVYISIHNAPSKFVSTASVFKTLYNVNF